MTTKQPGLITEQQIAEVQNHKLSHIDLAIFVLPVFTWYHFDVNNVPCTTNNQKWSLNVLVRV